MKLTRIDQVGELTRGLGLPLPPIALLHLNVIVDGLGRALSELVATYGAGLASKEEKELNALLQARMNGLCAEDKLFSQLVACVVRGGESVSFDGKRLELRPDLSLYLTGRTTRFPLVVECKIIDSDDGKGVDLYCSKGVRRFVDGEYAWASSEALMIAYVRDGSSVNAVLTPHLSASACSKPDPLRTEAMPVLGSTNIWTSRHGRAFEYVDSEQGKPGSIGISHLWFPI